MRRLSEFDIPLSNINQVHLSILIELKYFEIKPDNIVELRGLYPELVEKCILVNKDLILENIADYDITKDDIDLLVDSQELNQTEKLKFIYSIKIDKCTQKIAIFLRNVDCRIDKDWFEVAWSLLEKDKKYQLFINQIELLTNNEIAEKMEELDSDYQNFTDRSRRHEERLSYTDYNIRLVDHLKSVGYITSSRIEEKVDRDIITQEKKVTKFISCWVKKA